MAFPVPVKYRWVDRAYGEKQRSLEIVPAVAVSFTRPNLIFPDTRPRPVQVRLRSNAGVVKGEIALEAPAGFQVEPAAIPFEMTRHGQDLAIAFQVTPPERDSGGTLAARVRTGGDRIIEHGMQQIEYEHIPIQMVYPKAELRVERADIKLLSKNVGYIMGAGDTVPEAIEQLGATVAFLSGNDLSAGDLSRFDAIVTGVRALDIRPDLAAARERLLDYVEQGGTLVVQYNTTTGGRGRGERPAGLAPYPATLSRDRVTFEDAPVSFASPDHPLLQAPNRITPRDFEGWVQERGLYFMGTWDNRYQTVLSCHDPGEPPLAGGMLYARYGKGVYIYTAYSWFRQLPAGVPGAYRVFANLLSAGRAE
jgi:hypothetical protein